jgi:diacylglycerol O-acyltransferase
MTQRIRLRPMDAAFLLAETRTTPIHVAGLQVFRVPKGASRHFVSELYAYMRGFPVTAEPFNYQLDGRLTGKLLPNWDVRDDVDLDYHFRYSALPHPGGERELGILVSRLHSVHMDLSRPLWEMHLIEGLQGNRFAIYVKLHHALVDGVAAMKLLTLLNDPEKGFAPPIWAAELGEEFSHRGSDGSLLERTSEVLQKELAGLPSLTRGVAKSAKSLFGLSERGDLTEIGEAPRTILNVKISGQRRVATQLVDLARVKSIARAAGGTINDIVLTACGGALRHYLSSLGKLPDKSLIASVPVALMREEREAAGNAVTSFLARIGTDIADPRRRFEEVKRSSEAGKAHLKEMTESAVANYTMILAAPVLITSWFPDLGTLAPPLFNLIISNVPGPRARLRFHGAEMEAFYPVSQIGQGMALNISLIGYADQLAFGLVACRDSVPSVQRLAVAIGEAFDELEAAFLSSTPKAAATPERRKKARPARSSKGSPAGKAPRRRTRARGSRAPS